MTDFYANADTARDARDAAAYREMMGGVDTGNYEKNTEMRQAQRAGMTTKLVEAIGDTGHQNLSGAARDAVIAVRDTITKRDTDIEVAATRINSILSNQREFPPARIEDAEKVIGDTSASLSGSAEVFESLYSAAEYALYEESRPMMSQGEESSARSDARMLLDGAKPTEIGSRARDYVIANGDDSVSALMADERWMKTYLTSRGVDSTLSNSVLRSIRATVADSARWSTNPMRAAAGKSLANLHHYRAAYDATRGMANTIDPRRTR